MPLDSQSHAHSTHSPGVSPASPQPTSPAPEHRAAQWFLIFIVSIVLLDIWFDLETGLGIPGIIARYLITRGGR